MSGTEPTIDARSGVPDTTSGRSLIPRAIRFLATSGQIVGMATAAFVYTGLVLGGVHPTWTTLLCTYLIGVPIYAYDYAEGRVGAYLVGVLVLFPLLLLGVLISQGQFRALAIAAGLLLFGLAYGSVFKPLTTRIPGFKDVYVAVMWTLLLPFAMACERAPWSWPMTLSALFLFLMVVVNVSACDVKDMREDALEGMRTLAVVLGVPRVFVFLHALNLLLVPLLLGGVLLCLFPVYAVVLLLAVPYTALFLRGIRRTGGGKLHMAYVVDGMQVWMALLLALFAARG